MLHGMYYLNNKGTKWVAFDNGKKEKCLIETDNGIEERTVLFYEGFGNFAVACVSWKGKKIKKFFDYRFETNEETKNHPKHWNGMCVINLKTKGE